MGKYLLIKDADFSESAVEQVVLKKYFYNLPDSLLESGSTRWDANAFSYAQGNQDSLSGHVINGIRLNVERIGSLTIYKATKPINGLTSREDLTQVSTATTNKTGIQDIEFSTPVTLGDNECIVIGNTGDTMRGLYHESESPMPSEYYFFVGYSNITKGTGLKSLDIDYFEYVNS